MTRQEYMTRAREARSSEELVKSYREYYGQYVTEEIKALVRRGIGLRAILRAKDMFFAGICLSRWDALVSQIPHVDARLRNNGDWLSLGTGVCILKEAAFQILESEV